MSENEIFYSNDKKFVRKKIVTDLNTIPCNIFSILRDDLLHLDRSFRHIRDKKPKIRLNFRIRKLEAFKSYFIESIIESKSFAELKQYIIDRYGDD